MTSIYRSHALRGNSSCIAPAMRDAERHQRRSHAERGNDKLKAFTTDLSRLKLIGLINKEIK